mmetsp:Transcript_177849/g.570422  ORF Transcript_177849/g.570422 Transcript_177849/m.570422 type:complete len:200 (-) Transcript_177849:1829-2428(-)
MPLTCIEPPVRQLQHQPRTTSLLGYLGSTLHRQSTEAVVPIRVVGARAAVPGVRHGWIVVPTMSGIRAHENTRRTYGRRSRRCSTSSSSRMLRRKISNICNRSNKCSCCFVSLRQRLWHRRRSRSTGTSCSIRSSSINKCNSCSGSQPSEASNWQPSLQPSSRLRRHHRLRGTSPPNAGPGASTKIAPREWRFCAVAYP